MRKMPLFLKQKKTETMSKVGKPRGLPKSGGRLPGVENKISVTLRNQINDFLNENWQQVQADFQTLEPKDRLQFYERLLSYGLPKPAPEQSTATTPKVDFYSEMLVRLNRPAEGK